MSDRLLSKWPSWRDKATLELRTKNVPGDQIGDILTEVETHLDETGESPEDAFGEPGAYVSERLDGVGMAPASGSGWIANAIGGAISGLLLGYGAWQFGAGDPVLGNIPAWIGLLLGVAGLAFVFGRIEPDLVTDPRSGRPLVSARSGGVFVAATFGGAAVILFLAGWFLSR